jgi:hypothetical protein
MLACRCFMSILSCWCYSVGVILLLLRFDASCLCFLSVLPVCASCLCFLSVLPVCASCLCVLSMCLVYVACQCYPVDVILLMLSCWCYLVNNLCCYVMSMLSC